MTFPFRWPSVSIHVPARGTTIVPVSPFQDPFVSIHVPARGTTDQRCSQISSIKCFNPRSRKGNDKTQNCGFSGLIVSIHVPARGTTCTGIIRVCLLEFQSTFPQGERLPLPVLIQIPFQVSIHVPARGTTQSASAFPTSVLFQSTFPQGERQQVVLLQRLARLFQSTFPQGERRLQPIRQHSS